ncbi:MAG: triose-phosphate isomerase [Thermodesulfobacteriota bacterium]
MRTPLIAGNWKMHTTLAEAASLASAVARACEGRTDRQVMLAPPFTHLATVAAAVAGSPVLLAGQNVAWEEKGAFTGEISPVMLRELGCAMAIVGHSERRQIFGESDGMINRRLLGTLRFGLAPVLCVGETLEEREAGSTFAVLERQLRAGLAGVDGAGMAKAVIAYEPVWAIGTGRTATEFQAQEVHAFLRDLLTQIHQKTVASHTRILYGGSVKPENIDSLMQQDDIDGALVGGAALQADSFIRIVSFKQ